MKPYKILIVDDFKPFCRAVCSALGQRPEFEVIGEASNRLEGIRKVRKCVPEAKIVFVTQEFDPYTVDKAFDTSALGYVHKNRVQRDLIAALETVLRGGQFVSVAGYQGPRRADCSQSSIRRFQDRMKRDSK